MNKIGKTLEALRYQYPEDFGIIKPSTQEIYNAEKTLNIRFSDEYKRFLLKFGSVVLPRYLISGLSEIEEENISEWSVLSKTNFYKKQQQWPGIDDWYVISDDGRGNPIGCKPDGSVWLSDHDSNFEQVKLADNFEEFIEKILDDRLYEE